MAKTKQFVFSARVSQEGLRLLNELKSKLNISWDSLVVEAVAEHYNLDKAILSLPKKEAPAKPEGQTSTAAEPAGEPASKEQETESPPAKKKGSKKQAKENNEIKVEA